MRNVLIALLLIAGLFVPICAMPSDKKVDPATPRLVDHLPKDPILVFVVTMEDLVTAFDDMLGFAENFDESLAKEKIDAKIAEFEGKLNCSLRSDLLAEVGPEFGMVLDLPPIDQMLAAITSPEGPVPADLGDFALLAMVRDEKKVDSCLRRLIALAEGESVEDEGLVRVRFSDAEKQAPSSPGPTHLDLFFGFREGIMALSASRDVVQAALGPGVDGRRLIDGSDFSRVFSHLDQAPENLMYVNLPKIRSLVEASAFVQNMLDSKPEARKMADLLLDPELFPMGFGSSSIEIDGGTRTTSFGPSVLSGGVASTGIVAAIAIPNLLNAVDRGKQKRTMADIRSAGTAFESYAIDNNRYPGPTDGWVRAEEVRSFVEPVYIRTLPELDGWGHPLLFLSDGESYVIVSPGKDGIVDRDWSDGIDFGASTSFNADIVMANGQFIAWPEGPQE